MRIKLALQFSLIVLTATLSFPQEVESFSTPETGPPIRFEFVGPEKPDDRVAVTPVQLQAICILVSQDPVFIALNRKRDNPTG